MARQEAGKVWTNKVRLSYARIWEPDENGRYSCTLLVPKTDKQTIQALKQAETYMRSQAKDFFKGKVPSDLKVPLHDGDKPMPQGGEWGEAAKGHIVVRASSRTKPGIVDLQRQEITDSLEVYSGCYARVTINFFLYDNKDAGAKGMSIGLGNIQKVADGEALGGRARAEDDFAESEDWMSGSEDGLGDSDDLDDLLGSA